MYVYINSQGRVLETITSEQVNQGSDEANRIHFYVEGLTRAQNPTVTAQFRLPDGTTVAKPISANVEDPGYLPESEFDYRVFKPDYPYLFWYCDLDSELLAQDGTLQCSLIVQIGGQTVITTVQGMITIAVKESAVDDPNLTLSQYEYLLYWIGDQTAGKYVLKVGDAMSGPLSTPKITVDEISSDGETVAIDKPIRFGSEIYSYSELGESGLTVRGLSGQSWVSPTEIGASAGSSYIKFSFSGSSPIIETAVTGGSAIRNYLPTSSGFLGKLADDVASAYLGYRSEDGHLFLEITKQDGSTINSDVDLPLESAIVGMTYDHDTQTITFTLTSGATVTVPVSDIFQGVVTLDNGGWARENQMSVAIVLDDLHNINGKALTNFASEPYDDGTYQGYYILTADDEAFLTKEQAAVYMKAMTGSEFVPEYDCDHPTNSYFIFASDKSLWKPQWSESTGLVLYSMRTTIVDIESTQTITGVKTINNDLYLHRALKFDTYTYINQTQYNLFFSSTTGHVMFNGNASPWSDSSFNLGGSARKWKNLYLAGNISDGVNSFSAATIANIIRINALAVTETSYSSVLPMTIPSVVGSAAIVDDSKMRIKSIKGKCVAWSQMIENGNFASNSVWTTDANTTATYANGAVTIALLANGYGAGIRQQTVARVVQGHKYLIKCVGTSNDAAVGLRVTQYSYGASATTLSTGNVALGTSEIKYGVIATATATSTLGTEWRVVCIRTNGTSVSGDSVTIKNLQIFDLTLIYGAGNEPTTVAQFEADFKEGYYQYDLGSIRKSQIGEISCIVPANLLGESVTYIYPAYSTANIYIAWGQVATGYGHGNVMVENGHKYMLMFHLERANPDATASDYSSGIFKVYPVGAIGSASAANNVYENGYVATFPTATANANDASFYIRNSVSGFSAGDKVTAIAIDLTANGDDTLTYAQAFAKYRPLFGELSTDANRGATRPLQTIQIPSSIRGYAEKGAGSEQDILDVEGKRAITHCAEITMGSLTWLYAGANLFYTALPGAINTPNANVGALVCGKYATAPRNGLPDKSCCISGTDIVVKDTEYSSAATFQSAVSDVKIVYGLATPTSADISADLEGFSPYLDMKIGGKVECDCEVKPTLEASFAAYE